MGTATSMHSDEYRWPLSGSIQQFIYWRQSCPVDPIFNVCINGLNAVLYDDIWEEAAHNTNATDRTRNISIYISTISTLPTMVRWFRGDSRGIFSLESYRRKPGSRALQPTAMCPGIVRVFFGSCHSIRYASRWCVSLFVSCYVSLKTIALSIMWLYLSFSNGRRHYLYRVLRFPLR
jgi:hypothetical protein